MPYCLKNHPLIVCFSEVENQECSVCFSNVIEHEKIKSCKSCKWSLCFRCDSKYDTSPDGIKEKEFSYRPVELYPSDRTIVCTMITGTLTDVSERVQIIVASILGSDNAIKQVISNPELGRAWVIFSEKEGLDRFRKGEQFGELDLLDNASISWRMYEPPSSRRLYQVRFESDTMSSISLRKNIEDQISIKLDIVAVNLKSKFANIVFNRGEHDLDLLDERNFFCEDEELVLQPTKATLDSHYTLIEDLPTDDEMEDQKIVEEEKIEIKEAKTNQREDKKVVSAKISFWETKSSSKKETQTPFASARKASFTRIIGLRQQRYDELVKTQQIKHLTPAAVALTRDSTSSNVSVPATLSTKLTLPLSIPSSTSISLPKMIDCAYCYENTQMCPFLKFKGLQKSTDHHPVCEECAKRYVEVKINDLMPGSSLDIKCPCNCENLLSYTSVRDIMKSSPIALEKFDQKLSEAELQQRKYFRWCSNPNCSSGQEVPPNMEDPVWTCRICGYRTCFKHSRPATAKTFSIDPTTKIIQFSGTQQCCSGALEDSEILNKNWLKANTRPCPKCKQPIEKNGGCNHMTCQNCSYEYYWCCNRNFRDRTEASLHNRLCN